VINFHLFLTGLALVGLPVAIAANNLHAQAPTPPTPTQPSTTSTEVPELPPAPKGCVYLKEISTGNTEIRKQVRLGDENTDFAVPTGTKFSSYMPQLLGENNAKYGIKLYFKYNDGSNAKVFDKSFPLQRFERVSAKFTSPSGKQPYQVNFRVSSARNNAYRISILGCQ
jgi:hypothetical protein